MTSVAQTLDEHQVRMTLPADPAYGRLARIAASALALRLRMPIPKVADLRLALDETVILLMHPDLGATDVDFVFTLEPASLVIEAITRGSDRPPPEALERFEALVTGLVSAADVLSEPLGVRLRCERDAPAGG
jgi:hypothetical protein